MACKIVWSPAALDDVEAIASYIARDSQMYAAMVVQKVLDIVDSLKEFPDSGRIVPELGDVFVRERFVYSYRIIYRFAGESITIVAIVHGRRLLEPLAETILAV